MNYKKACAVLQIPPSNEVTHDLLKKQYRLLALKYHPDKNKQDNAVSIFQEIQESYEYLIKYNDFMNNDSSDEDEPESDNKKDYKFVLLSFLKNILVPDNRTKLYYTILKQISSTCEANAIELLKKVEKENLIKIYDILEKHRELLHFSDAFFNDIKKIIQEKVKDDECVILNPTIDDLFENNLYRLKINEFVYVVPLWHNELVYDNSGNDIYVKCNPILPENIEIDEKNNITIEVQYGLKEILDKEIINIDIGKQRFYLKRENLKISKSQSFSFMEQGISRINTKNIYDVSNKSDIIIKINLLF